MPNVLWFSEIGRLDTPIAGGKGANLGELYNLGVSIPNGFVVTATAYFETIKASGVEDKIRAILFGLDVDNPTLLETKAKAAQAEILKLEFDKKLESEIEKFYEKLGNGKNVLVAVRSSATAEDLPDASFAGQQSTFLNVKGKKELKEAILGAWASLFEARAIFYRVQKNYDHFKVGIAIPVQIMVQSEVSGVMFTIDPVTNSKNTIVVEAIYGLGEYIVGGIVTPDHYEVDKQKWEIKNKTIVIQEKQLVKSKVGNKALTVSKPYQKLQKLPDEKIIELAKMGHKIEKHYFFPQDLEWAYENETLYIVQTRPITTINNPQVTETKAKSVINLPVLLQGAPASPVIGSGKVVIVKSPKEIFKVERGDVLVAEMTNPDYVPAMKKASAIVTDKGGRTSHAAIVSRELGIACVVGTENATKKLKAGQMITVDGSTGVVYDGRFEKSKKDLEAAGEKPEFVGHKKTATHLYVNLAEPELAEKIARLNVDGIGLLRAEFVLAQIGEHPKEFLRRDKGEDFIDKLTGNLKIFASAFGNRNVIYRASDFKSNEYRNLKGGDKYEPQESNPMLGYRGAFRYIKDPDVFKLELEAIKRIREKHKNFHLMIPFVRNVNELIAVKKIVEDAGLFEDRDFKFWMMCEIPVNVLMLEEFIAVGIDGISIGSNDLTMLILGTDRDNDEVASEFDERNPAVLWALEKVIKTCAKLKVTCGICGQAPSVYPELTEKLVSWGITSVSVNPDAIETTRQIIYEAEKKLLNK